MKRDQLKELGLAEDVINKIMDLNGADIEKAKASNTEVLQENEALKAQIKERDKDLKDLRKNAKDNEELSNSYKELQAKYDKDTADLSSKLSQTRLNNALDNALSRAGVRNSKAMKALLNMDEVKLDKEGNLTGLDDQVKAIKQSDSYLFSEGEKADKSVKAVTTKKVAKKVTTVYAPIINNDPNWKIALRDSDGHLTGKYIRTNTTWKLIDTVNIKGVKYYKLGTNQQLAPAKYFKKK